MPQAPDLFVVCRNCGSEVSSYVTECPYCGTRLRKRAPKLEGSELLDGRGTRRKPKVSRLPKLKAGEIPGIRADPTHGPYLTFALCIAIALGTIALASSLTLDDVAIVGQPDGDWWKVATAPFFTTDLWYAVISIVTIAVFGWRLEERHGPLVVLALFCLCGIGGIAAAAAIETVPLAAGANGAALGFVAAYAIRPVRELRQGDTPDADLLGVAVFALVLLLTPLVVEEASPTAGVVGLLAGLVAGVPLARRR